MSSRKTDIVGRKKIGGPFTVNLECILSSAQDGSESGEAGHTRGQS